MTREQAIEIYFLEDSNEQIRKLALLKQKNELSSNDLFNYFSVPIPMVATASPYVPIINMLLLALQNIKVSEND